MNDGSNTRPTVTAGSVSIDPTTQTAGGTVALSAAIEDADDAITGAEYNIKLATDPVPAVDDAGWTAVTITAGQGTQSATITNEAITVPNVADSYSVYVRGSDAEGPGAASDPAGLVVEEEGADTVPPVVQTGTVQPTPGTVNLGEQYRIDAVVTDDVGVVSAEYDVVPAGQDPSDWKAMTVSAPGATTTPVEAANIDAPATSGEYSVCVRGFDDAGNESNIECGTLAVSGVPVKVGLSASKAEILTDGADFVTLTATLLDANDNPVADDPRDVTVTLSEATYANLDEATKAFGTDGTVEFTLTSTGTEVPDPATEAPFTASAASDGLDASAPVTITAQNDADELQSLAIAPIEPTVMVGGEVAFAATATYRDAGEVVVTDQATWTVTAGTPGNGTITATGVFTATEAGTATVQADFEGQQDTATVTIQETAAGLSVDPPSAQVVEGGDPVVYTISGVPAEVTDFTVTDETGAEIPAENGTFTVTLGSPETTVTYAPPAKSAAIAETVDFTARFTAVGGTLDPDFVEVQNRMIALIDYAGTVTDGTAPVEGVDVTALFDDAKTATTDPDGNFVIEDIEVADVTYGFTYAKDGYNSRTLDLTAQEILAGDDVVLEFIGNVAGTIAGTVTLTDTANVGSVMLGLKADGVDVTVGGTPLAVFADPTTGAYVFQVPEDFGGADNYTVTATKFGYVPNPLTFNGPLDIPDADIGLDPVTAIFPRGNLQGNLLGLNITASPNFTNADGEIAISGDFATTDFDFTGAGYFNSIMEYAGQPIRLNIQASTTIRNWCYVSGQSNATTQTVFNPNANAGEITTPRGVTVRLPAGGLTGAARERVTLYAVDAVPAEAYGDIPAENQLVAGPVMVEVVLIGADRQAVPDSEIGQVEIAMPYDEATIDPANLLDGTTPIFKIEGPAPDGSLHTDTLCDMIAGAGGMAVVDTAQIVSAESGMVTFVVDSLSSFGIGNPDAVLLPPTITSLSPSNGLPTAGNTTVTVNGSNLLSVTELLVGGVATDFIAVSDVALTFQTPPGAAGTARTVQARNVAGLSGTLSFTYAGSSPLPPTVNFEVVGFEDEETIEIEAGTELEFRDRSTGTGIFRREWFFNADDPDAGEEFQSDDRNPTFTYEEPGTYSVRLEVRGSGGSDALLARNFIVVLPAQTGPDAAFTVSPGLSGCAPFTVTLTDASQGEVASREWFVDGETRGSDSPLTLTFDEPGTFAVTLQVTGPDGETDTSAARNIVAEDCPPGENVADFSFEILPFPDCRTVRFTNTSQGEVVAQVWQIPGAVPTDEANPEFTFPENGQYDVTLNVVFADDESLSITKTVAIDCAVATTIDASFTVSSGEVFEGDSVVFTDASTATNVITSREWDFDGDGQIDAVNQTEPVFVYDNPGTFTARLTVSGPDGTDSFTRNIVVNPVISGLEPPVGLEPADGATEVGLTPILRIAPFAGAAGDYGATEWQIALPGETGQPVFSGDTLVWSLVKRAGTDDDFMLEIPEFLLDNGPRTYYWRVRFRDAQGDPSAWAGPYMFRTVAVDPEDANDDDIPDDQEVDDPVAIFPGLNPANALYVRAATGDGYWALEGVDNVTLVELKAFTTQGAAVPPNTEMPLGLIGYKLMTSPAGDARVRVHFSTGAPENAVWLAFLQEGWMEFSGSAAVFGPGMTSVTLTLTDGGFGDLDGIANGVIIVPLSGFGVVEPEVVDGGGGGSDTCFISATRENGGVSAALMALVAFAALALRRSSLR